MLLRLTRLSPHVLRLDCLQLFQLSLHIFSPNGKIKFLLDLSSIFNLKIFFFEQVFLLSSNGYHRVN